MENNEKTVVAGTPGFEPPDSDAERKTEISETELGDVSGGGSGLALCIFSALAVGHLISDDPSLDVVRNGRTIEKNGEYWTQCGHRGNFICTWAGCRCHGTSHCKDGWHKSQKDGMYIIGHGWTT